MENRGNREILAKYANTEALKWLMNATDSALKPFGNVWKFRKSHGTGLAGKIDGPPGEFVLGKAICQTIIQKG
jgi:hypothetical protein